MNQWHYNKIKQLKDWERDLSAVLTFKSNEMDEETRKDTIRYRDLLVYAIEQIERVQELEDKLARIRFINNDYDKQNKRYREAREIIEQEYKEHNVGVVYGYEDGYLDGLDTAMDIIDKALEGEE